MFDNWWNIHWDYFGISIGSGFTNVDKFTEVVRIITSPEGIKINDIEKAD